MIGPEFPPRPELSAYVYERIEMIEKFIMLPFEEMVHVVNESQEIFPLFESEDALDNMELMGAIVTPILTDALNPDMSQEEIRRIMNAFFETLPRAASLEENVEGELVTERLEVEFKDSSIVEAFRTFPVEYRGHTSIQDATGEGGWLEHVDFVGYKVSGIFKELPTISVIANNETYWFELDGVRVPESSVIAPSLDKLTSKIGVL